ncbi:carboxymuconolactone decarboxylase family protein [Conexibacter sp. SYSU D00693]|uniref:carboxymuconolactone decarboxylase family protein n=1 Tax=Conexibacter sp. SYSU D00693 TaxID=2812560 RepID=UPI00196AD16E|nr:carboxymuconolactone decarboxylase family protein [Conexibacter sp. SYSU D00693]
MSRIPPLEPADQPFVVRRALRSARKKVGLEPAPFTALARHRRLFLAEGGFELALEGCHAAPERLKELAVLRTAMVVGCEFCCDIGSALAQTKAGITEDELRDLARWRESPRFDAHDRLALELAEAMARTPEETTDELVGRLREALGDEATIELIVFCGWESFRARTNAAMGFGAQGFSEGAYCVAPDRDALSAAPAGRAA